MPKPKAKYSGLVQYPNVIIVDNHYVHVSIKPVLIYPPYIPLSQKGWSLSMELARLRTIAYLCRLRECDLCKEHDLDELGCEPRFDCPVCAECCWVSNCSLSDGRIPVPRPLCLNCKHWSMYIIGCPVVPCPCTGWRLAPSAGCME